MIYSEEELDDLIEKWHQGSSGVLLHELLGWTWEQYISWLETGVQPHEVS